MTKRILLVLSLAALFVALAATVALAGGTNIPHGGYSASTDACLQCHDVHESAGDYVLLRYSTVQDTCGSCHFLYNTVPPLSAVSGASRSPIGLGSQGWGSYSSSPEVGSVPAYNPNYSGDETVAIDGPGTDPLLSAPVTGFNSIGSRTSAYETANYASRGAAPGHNLQTGAVSGRLFNDGVTAGSEYIPGGSGTLNAIQRAGYGSNLTVSTMSFAATQGLYCASCHTPHGNFGQQLLKSDGVTPVSTKLLSGKPNHAGAAISIDSWTGQGGKWCEACHDKRVPEKVIGSTTYHNHPDFACLQCHGNYVGDKIAYQQNSDFPHTSKLTNLLSNEPDALCVTCHVARTLP